jgi:hypothetical protein
LDRQERPGRQSEKLINLINLIKLAVGVRDVAHLAEIQAARAIANPPLRHHTRNFPKRAKELCAGGSIYWVINRAVQARQFVRDVIEDRWDDGSRCAGLVLDPALIRVTARAVKPFQGWRYLTPLDAPADLDDAGNVSGIDELPDGVRLALTHLALL